MRLRPALLSLLAVLALCSCEKKQAPAASRNAAPATVQPTTGPLVIGTVGALTGPEAHYGSESQNGAQLAVEEVNAAGGVQGRQLVIRSYDSQSRPEEAVNAMTRLVTQDRALFVVGENQSSLSLAMAPAAAQGQVPMIAPSSTNPRVTTEGGPYVFRVCFTDTFQGELLARFARETLKADRVAMLVDQKSDYALGLAKVFSTRFAALGGKIVADEAYSKGDTDFRSQLTRAKAERPQVLFIPGYYSDVGPMARQARELGMQAKLLGGDGWDSGERPTTPAAGCRTSSRSTRPASATFRTRSGRWATTRRGSASTPCGAREASGARRCRNRSPAPATSTASPAASRSGPTATP